MAEAEELLDSEPELKALVLVISKRNGAINTSTQFISYLMQHVDKSVLNLPECQKLMQDWIETTKSAVAWTK